MRIKYTADRINCAEMWLVVSLPNSLIINRIIYITDVALVMLRVALFDAIAESSINAMGVNNPFIMFMQVVIINIFPVTLSKCVLDKKP